MTWLVERRESMRWKTAELLTLAVQAVGCSSNDKKEPGPAELVKFDAEIELKREWSRSIGKGQGETYNLLKPVVYGNEIFAADVRGLVVAMDRQSGKVNWKKDLDVPVSGAVGAGYGLVLVGTLRGEVLALDVSNGEERWRSQVSSEVLAAPGVNSDVEVGQRQDDQVIALENDNGEQRGSDEDTHAVLTLRRTGAPLLSNGLARAGVSSGKVVALNTRRGLPVWEQ